MLWNYYFIHRIKLSYQLITPCDEWNYLTDFSVSTSRFVHNLILSAQTGRSLSNNGLDTVEEMECKIKSKRIIFFLEWLTLKFGWFWLISTFNQLKLVDFLIYSTTSKLTTFYCSFYVRNYSFWNLDGEFFMNI